MQAIICLADDVFDLEISLQFWVKELNPFSNYFEHTCLSQGLGILSLCFIQSKVKSCILLSCCQDDGLRGSDANTFAQSVKMQVKRTEKRATAYRYISFTLV